MKNMFWKMCLALFMVFGLTGCGGGGETTNVVYIESGAKVAITGTNTQQIQFRLNADGSLKDLDKGSVKVMPSDVDYVAFCSDRVGFYENSRVKGAVSASGLVKFEGMPNSDSGFFVAFLKNGDNAEILTNKEVSTYRPMEYSIDVWNWYTYGQFNESYATMTLVSNEVHVVFNFNCDQLVGTTPYVTYKEGSSIVFIEKTGKVHQAGYFYKNPQTGNLTGFSTIPMPTAVNAQNQSELCGRFYVVLPSGFTSEINFDWSDPAMTWQLESDSIRLLQVDDDSGDVIIRLQR